MQRVSGLRRRPGLPIRGVDRPDPDVNRRCVIFAPFASDKCDGKVTPVGPGAMMYCAGNTLHGITNTGSVQMTFYWSKWLAEGFSA